MLLIFIYFCVIFVGDVHVGTSPKNIAQKYIKMSNMADITKNITQKYIKMRNMDITKQHSTEIYKDEQHGVMSMLLIFMYFCVMFFGDVSHVAHLYIFLCYVFGDVHQKT
jgi:hypothetical protein